MKRTRKFLKYQRYMRMFEEGNSLDTRYITGAILRFLHESLVFSPRLNRAYDDSFR